jgi:hypothetical protein
MLNGGHMYHIYISAKELNENPEKGQLRTLIKAKCDNLAAFVMEDFEVPTKDEGSSD